MTVIACIAVVALAGVLVWVLRAAQFDRERHAEMIANLCQRIQAPEQAVIDHSMHSVQLPRAIPIDDDEAHWETQQLTREQLAAAYTEAELSGSVRE